MKILFQDICKSKINWDDELPDELKNRWFKIISDISENSYFEINRPYVNIDDNESVKIYELHGFSDANPKSYGACIYLRTIKQNGEINVSLVAAKSRVAPLNPHSIPRTELLGNLLLARLMNSVKKALEAQVTISDELYYTDSTICLSWIKAFDKVYKTFVQNPMNEIRKLSKVEKSNYDQTKSNPADMLTKFSPNLFKVACVVEFFIFSSFG